MNPPGYTLYFKQWICLFFSAEVMDCIECGKTFFGNNVKFCSMKCYKDHMDDLKKERDSTSKK